MDDHASTLGHRSIAVAIAGESETLTEFTRMFTGELRDRAFPWLAMVGVCLLPGTEPFDPPPGFPQLYHSVQDLLADHPDVRFLFNVSDDPEYSEALRRIVPRAVTLADPSITFLLQDLVGSEDICFRCRQELKRTRSLFYTLFDEIDEDLLLIDPKGRVLNANRHVLDASGTSPRDFSGLQCCDIGQGKLCPGLVDKDCLLTRVLETGRKAETMHTYVDEDGRMRYFRLYAYPISDNGEISHVILLRRDITARTHMEKRIQQSQTLASIGELATYIAHEIRNPLFAIGGFANSLLRTEVLPEEARQKAEIILDESKRLDSILKATLNFTRPTEPNQVRVSLNSLIPETMKILHLDMPDKGVHYSFRPGEGIALAMADPELIKQCLINIVKNATEAMPDGGSLTIETGMSEDMVYFSVGDTGSGIPDSIRDKIFNPFFSTKNKGAGLGLPMTKKIVEDMGGRVIMETREGEGTRFTILLRPVLAVDDPGEEPTQAEA